MGQGFPLLRYEQVQKEIDGIWSKFKKERLFKARRINITTLHHKDERQCAKDVKELLGTMVSNL
jgi:hypothetical protein